MTFNDGYEEKMEIFMNIFTGDLVSVECMGDSMTFFIPSNWKPGQNKKFMSTFMFLAEYDEIPT